VYSLIRNYGVRKAFKSEAPSFAAAFIIASLFYEFHSFALECAAFLATWYVISWAYSLLARTLAAQKRAGA